MNEMTGPSGQKYFFHSDMSGKVHFKPQGRVHFRKSAIEMKGAAVLLDTTNPSMKDMEAFIPAEDLLALAAEYIRRKKISDIESLSTEELLS